MRIPIDDITEMAATRRYDEDLGDLNTRLAQDVGAPVVERHLPVELTYYRAGADLIFEGQAEAKAVAPCSRCLEEYVMPLVADFRVALPVAGFSDGAEDGLEAVFVGHDEIDVAPIVHDQLLLSLPTQLVCSESCRGLCPGCGANRNTTSCACVQQEVSKPRLAVLHDLVRSGR
jgi:uncharacterized protein